MLNVANDDGSVDVARPAETLAVRRGDRAFDVVTRIGDADFVPFWTYFAQGSWEPDLLAMIDALPTERSIFVDVGGWIGPTCLWAAFRQPTVIAFEPDPVALAALRANVALNPEIGGRIRIVPAAAGACDGDLVLHSARFGMSETSVFDVVERHQRVSPLQHKLTTPMVDLARFVRNLSPNEHRIFIKVDIEGAEFALLPHMANLVERYDVTICATLHGQNIVADTPDRTAASRLLTIAKCLEPFKALRWFKFDGAAFAEVEKFPYLVAMLNDFGRDATFIASRSAL